MRKYLLMFLFLFLAHIVCAQKLKIESFVAAESDMTAQSNERLDSNGKKCAVVKVRVALDGLKFDGAIHGDVVHRLGEYWVYMPMNASELHVYHANYIPIDINFHDYGIGRVKSGTTYILTLNKPNVANEPVDARGNFYAISIKPKTAVLWINGKQQEVSADGEYSAMLPYGSHSYRVEAGGYISKNGTFTISSGDMTPISVSLVSAMATVSVTCPTPAVSLYVDKKLVGNAPWTGNLKEGMHLIEARKSGYRSTQKTIQLSQQQRMDVSLEALTAIKGNLSVNYKPFGADVYVDGTKIGQSPRVFNGLLIGSHQVEVRKAGYNTERKSVTVAEGQTVSMTGSLTVTSSSPSSMSGNTISIPVKDGISIEMVKVEAGSFMMGATPEMKNPDDDEKPFHRVTLTNDYYIGKYEVTQKLWQAVMGSNPSYFKGNNLPVENVCWNNCQEFISKLNSLTGRNFRLPSEAEWEYAARGGSNNLDAVAWYDGNSGNKTHAVGTKQPNELGLYDMAGNVWEWCQD